MKTAYNYLVYVGLLFCAISLVKSDTDACLKLDSCSCQFLDDRVLNLTSLSSTNGTAAFDTGNIDGYRYLYNPCTSFSGDCQHSDIAVCQSWLLGTYSCGQHHAARFVHRSNHNNSDIFIYYADRDNGRQSYIKLTCTNDTESTFNFLGEAPIRTYNFELVSRYACPGEGTHQDNLVSSPPTVIPTETTVPTSNVTCAQKDACTCEMSDGSGIINLRSLNKPGVPLEHLTDNAGYYYNPCSGFNLQTHSLMNTCIDVAVCEAVYAGEIISDIQAIGDPHTARISTKLDGTVIIHYHNSGKRKSDVHLICDRSARHVPIFRYLHDHGGTSIFSLRSVCACPGECVAPTRTCEPIDSCSCTYSDGSGTVNMHPIDNPFAPLRTTVHLPTGRYEYYFNPCSGLQLGGQCLNVSACQRGIFQNIPHEEYSLGKAGSETFTSDQNGNLILNYIGGYDGRTSTVTLVCDPMANVPVLETPHENPLKQYNFSLRSKCACPGLCS